MFAACFVCHTSPLSLGFLGLPRSSVTDALQERDRLPEGALYRTTASRKYRVVYHSVWYGTARYDANAYATGLPCSSFAQTMLCR